jgi:hypothetical protein
MANVYSRRLAQLVSAPSGTTDLGHAPDGRKWVIKDINVTQLGGLGYPRSGFEVLDGLGAVIFAVNSPFAVMGWTYHWAGTQTLEDGEHCFFHADDLGWSVRVSGYELVEP